LEKEIQAQRETQASSVVRKDLLFVCFLSAAYLLLSYWLVGFKFDQVFLAMLFSTLYLASTSTKKLILGFSIFIVYWIIFDYMKAFPNYQFNEVHIKSLYDLEVSLFGISTNYVLLSPSEYFFQHSSTWLDVASGLFYLTWVPAPLAFAAYLFYKNPEQFLRFALTFLAVNLIGFIIYYIYPAAPPWYTMQFGFDFNPDTPGNTAGLIRFDQFFGVQVFQSIYAKSSNVFAAMPSLHASYPLLALYYGLKNKLNGASIFFAVTMIGIWFAAVYTAHHYILDILAGIACGLIGIWLFNWLMKRSKWGQNFFAKYLQIIC
jgi:inositol phosphorylceramide synthase catalytic subunit